MVGLLGESVRSTVSSSLVAWEAHTAWPVLILPLTSSVHQLPWEPPSALCTLLPPKPRIVTVSVDGNGAPCGPHGVWADCAQSKDTAFQPGNLGFL